MTCQGPARLLFLAPKRVAWHPSWKFPAHRFIVQLRFHRKTSRRRQFESVRSRFRRTKSSQPILLGLTIKCSCLNHCGPCPPLHSVRHERYRLHRFSWAKYPAGSQWTTRTEWKLVAPFSFLQCDFPL